MKKKDDQVQPEQPEKELREQTVTVLKSPLVFMGNDQSNHPQGHNRMRFGIAESKSEVGEIDITRFSLFTRAFPRDIDPALLAVSGEIEIKVTLKELPVPTRAGRK